MRLFIRHNVEDYQAWRKQYDEFDQSADRWASQTMPCSSRSIIRTMSPYGKTPIRLKPLKR
jgi:hypothetical protein